MIEHDQVRVLSDSGANRVYGGWSNSAEREIDLREQGEHVGLSDIIHTHGPAAALWEIKVNSFVGVRVS